MADRRTIKIGTPIPLPPKRGLGRCLSWEYDVHKDYRGFLRADVTEYIVDDTEDPNIHFKCHSINIGGVAQEVGGWDKTLARVAAKPITQKKVDAMYAETLEAATAAITERRDWLLTLDGQAAIAKRIGGGF